MGWKAMGIGMAAALAAGGASAAPSTEVAVEQGRLQGALASDVAAFQGVPFAAPPVGDLRWRPPQPAPAWTGVRAADRFGAICMQKPDAKRDAGLPAQSEDCLTLNVWTTAAAGERRPVMVWIHGGGFMNGTGASPVYDGAAFARAGVVLVTLNYRLNRFGFFAHPALTAEADARGEPTANYGLMDQMAALEWVKRNIAAFGGDPGAVTIFGESSGAAAVNRLLISPGARGLFHRAISQSGNGREFTPRLKTANPDGLVSAEDAGGAFTKAMGAGSAADLRALPAQKIVDAGDRSAIEGGPVIDGRLLTQEVFEAFQRGEEAQVPLIVGSTGLETPVPPQYFEPAFTTFLKVSPDRRARMEAGYPSEAEFKLRAIGDIIFGEPARFLAAQHARHGQPAWLYRFSVLSPSMRSVLKDAPHASELPYVFQTLPNPMWAAGPDDPLRAAEIAGYWVAFAKAGDPNGDQRAPWPRYAMDEDRLMHFTNDGPAAKPTPDAKQLDAIASTYPVSPPDLSAPAAGPRR